MHHRTDSPWRRVTLPTRLNLVITSILVVTMAAFVALDYARERKALLSAEADRLAAVGASAEGRLPTPIYAVTSEDLVAVASASAGRPVTVYLVRDGRVALSSDRRTRELPALKRVQTSGSYKLWWTPTGLALSMPFRPSGRDVAAELFVETSLESVERVLSRTLRMHVLHGLATVLAMTLAVAWVLRRSVHRPFARMISAMHTMERGTWELDVPVLYRDEVGVLTAAFNRMGKKLTRTAIAFARAEKLAAIAVLAIRIRRELDTPLADIESAARRLTAPTLAKEEVRQEALRIRAAASTARRSLESLDELFLAELDKKLGSDCQASRSPG